MATDFYPNKVRRWVYLPLDEMRGRGCYGWVVDL